MRSSRVFAFLLHAYPSAFRNQYHSALLQTFEDQVTAGRVQGGRLRAMGVAVAECWNVLVSGLMMRWSGGVGHTVRVAHPRRPRWDSVVADVRFAMRTCRRKPAVALGAVALLAFGIGLNTAIFSVVNAYLLRSLPYPDSDRLVTIRTVAPGAPSAVVDAIPEGIWELDWPARDDVIEDAVTWDLDAYTLVGDGPPEVVRGAWVPPGYFRALGTKPAMGRLFAEADGAPGAASVAVISHTLWQRRFGGDADIVGKTVAAHVSDRPFEAEVFTIVGVLPADFWFINRYTEILTNLTEPRMPYMARLRPGVTTAQAASHLTEMVKARLDGIDPAWPGMYVVSTHQLHVSQVKPVLIVLAAAVGLVLLIACGNVALLLTVRAFGRQRELTVRRALGASRGRVIQQLATEGMLLALIAGVLGALLGWFATDALSLMIQEQLRSSVPGGVEAIGIDFRVLLVALGLSGLTGLIFAVVPALAAVGNDFARSLNEASRSASDTRARQFMRSSVIAAEIAISMTLVIGSALMLRTALHLHRVELGFVADDVLTANVNLRQRSYPEPHQLTGFVEDYLERIRSTPGVAVASITAGWPFQQRQGERVIAEGLGREQPSRVVRYVVTPTYFEALTIPIVVGRGFTERDRADTEPVAVVSETIAAELWPNVSPVGRRIQIGDAEGDAPWRTVVGVTRDVRETLTGDAIPDVYVPYAQQPGPFLFIIAKLNGTPNAVTSGIQQALSQLDPTSALTGVQMLGDLVAGQRVRPQFLAVLLTVFGVFAAALALTGLYSIVAYAVSQRRKDVAIYMALGAGDSEVVTLFLKNATVVIGFGVLAGLFLTAVLARSLESQFYGVSSVDLPVYVATAALLAAAALFAVWIPAHRATGMDPMRVLREE